MESSNNNTTTSLPQALPKNSTKVNLIDKFFYGVGCIGYSLPYQIIGASFLLYATVILGISPLWAGIIIAVSAVWDALTDPLMGYISDHIGHKRYGKRHPYMLVGGLFLALFTWLFWSIDPAQSLAVKTTLLFLYVIGLKTSLTIFVAPYNAFGAELSDDYDERTSIQGVRASFYIIGMILAIAGSNIVFFRSTTEFPKGQLNPEAYPAMGVTFSIIAIVFIALMLLTTRRFIDESVVDTTDTTDAYQSAKSDSEKFSLNNGWRSVTTSLKNKNFLALLLLIFFIEVGFQAGIAIGHHVNTYTYHLNGPQIGILGLLLLSCSIIFQPILIKLSKRWDKKPVLYLGMVFGLVGFIGPAWTHVWWEWFTINDKTILYTLIPFNIAAGIGNAAFMSLPYSMVADTIESGSQQTGERQAGLYFGCYTFAYKFGSSVSLVLAGVILHLIGFHSENEIQSESTQFYLAMAPTILLLLATPVALLALSKYSIYRNTKPGVGN